MKEQEEEGKVKWSIYVIERQIHAGSDMLRLIVGDWDWGLGSDISFVW